MEIVGLGVKMIKIVELYFWIYDIWMAFLGFKMVDAHALSDCTSRELKFIACLILFPSEKQRLQIVLIHVR